MRTVPPDGVKRHKPEASPLSLQMITKGSLLMTYFAGKTLRVLVLTTLSVLFLTAGAFAAEAGLAVDTGVTTGSGLRLRSEPSTEAGIVSTLGKDVTLAILDDSTDGWYQVAYNGKTGYVSAEFLEIHTDGVFESYGRVNASGVNVRATPSTDGEVLASLGTGDVVTATALADGWYSVTCTYGTEGYIRSDFLDLTSSSSSSNGGIVDLAKQYLGTRYRYGGASPSGFDCSGFTMYVYGQFGYSLPHTATGQWQSGMGTRVYSIGELQPGDLVFFNDPARNAGKACSHAGIYVGGGQIIHSSSSRSGGVIYSDLTSGYYNTYFIGGIHV